MVVTDTLINQVFDGRYRVLRRLGSGGMADVYLAEDPQVAGAVVVENQLNGFGGTVSAPIAKSLLEAILPAVSKEKP